MILIIIGLALIFGLILALDKRDQRALIQTTRSLQGTSRIRSIDRLRLQPPLQSSQAPWLLIRWKAVSAILAAIGLVSAVATFWPRVQFDVASKYDEGSPFPDSLKVTNGLWPLVSVSFYIRICQATNTAGGKFIGLKKCTGSSKGLGGITMPQWQNHILAMDEPWDIPLGPNVPVRFNAADADIRLVITCWPWLLYRPPLFPLLERERRLVIFTDQSGERSWRAQPID